MHVLAQDMAAELQLTEMWSQVLLCLQVIVIPMEWLGQN